MSQKIEIDKRRVELLEQIAYCTDGMFVAEAESNFGDAKEWKRQLELAREEYYDYLG